VKLAPHAPQVRARLAEALLELDSPERAGEQMLEVKREDLSWLSKSDRLRIDAIDLAITHEYPAAAAKYAQIVRETGDSAEIEVDLGRASNNAGKPDDAIRAFRRAAEGPEHSPAAWLRLGVLYGVQRKKKLSDDAFAEADRLYQLISSLEGIGETALQRGIAATARGELDSGARYLRIALDIAQHAGNWQQEITATLRLSTNAYIADDTQAAERYASDGLEMARNHNLDALAIRGLISLGNAFRLKQDYAGAEKRYREALDLAAGIHEPHLVANSRLSLAGLNWDLRRREQAAAEARQALAFYQPNHYAKEALQSETIIARFQRDTGDYDGALASLRSLLETAESLQDRQSIATAHGDLGNLLFNRDHLPEALEHYHRSLELAVDAQQAGYAAMQCGNTLWRLGRYAEAEAMFEKADAAAGKVPPLYLRLLFGRAAMLLSQDRYQEAEGKARGTMASPIVRDAEFDADANRILGLSLVRGGNVQAGLAFCERAWNAISSGSEMSAKVNAAAGLVEARVAAGKRDAAREILGQIEGDLGKLPETQWRVYAVYSSLDPAYSDRARDVLTQLSRAWGEAVYNTYLTRPDVAKLSRPLFRPLSASR
jgi:tetratricopeptide (TPR) repeat protein